VVVEKVKQERPLPAPVVSKPEPLVHAEPIHLFTPPVAEESAVIEDEAETEVEVAPEVEREFEPEVEAEPENEPVVAQEELPAPDLIPFEEPEAEPQLEAAEPPSPVILPVVATHFKTEMARAEPQPRLIVPKKKPVVLKESKPEKVQAKQEVMQFEPVSRGRFEKSEPTIVEGQDLDVPTYLRKNIRVK
jgi:cell division protein FtsZ